MLERNYKISNVVNSQLDTIPKHIWESETTTFIDFAMATGQHISGCIQRLRQCGHSDENIKGRVFGFESDPSQVALAVNMNKLIGTFEPIEYNELLTKGYKNMKFDCVVGNPPFQKDTNIVKDPDNKQGSFWYEFVKLGLRHLNDDGYIAMVCPKSLFGAGGWGTKRSKVTEMLQTIRFTNIWPDFTKDFTVSIDIFGFTAVKNKSNSIVRIGNSDDTVIIDGSVPVPFLINKTAFNVVRKCFASGFRTMEFREKINATPNDAVVRVNGGRFKIYSKIFVGLENETKHRQQGVLINTNEIIGFKSAVSSKLWEYLFKIMGGESGNSVTGIMAMLPVMNDMTRPYSNAEWYAAFGITDDEQADIEKFLEPKPKKEKKQKVVKEKKAKKNKVTKND